MNKVDAEEMTKLRIALEFYADPDTYSAIGFAFDPPCGGFVDDFSATGYPYDRPMPGQRARKALGIFQLEK